MTREEIIKLIWDEYEDAHKCKGDIWDKAFAPNADFEDVRMLHIYMGRECACRTLLEIIEGIEL